MSTRTYYDPTRTSTAYPADKLKARRHKCSRFPTETTTIPPGEAVWRPASVAGSRDESIQKTGHSHQICKPLISHQPRRRVTQFFFSERLQCHHGRIQRNSVGFSAWVAGWAISIDAASRVRGPQSRTKSTRQTVGTEMVQSDSQQQYRLAKNSSGTYVHTCNGCVPTSRRHKQQRH